MANEEVVPQAAEVIAALDKHPELRAEVHRLLGPRLPENMWVTNRGVSQVAQQLSPIDHFGPRDRYTIDVQFVVFGTDLEALLQMLHRNAFPSGP
jgi:hypothetical protein